MSIFLDLQNISRNKYPLVMNLYLYLDKSSGEKSLTKVVHMFIYLLPCPHFLVIPHSLSQSGEKHHLFITVVTFTQTTLSRALAHRKSHAEKLILVNSSEQ